MEREREKVDGKERVRCDTDVVPARARQKETRNKEQTRDVSVIQR